MSFIPIDSSLLGPYILRT